MDHLGENTVTELLEALLSAERRERIEAHAATCDPCRRLISELVRRSEHSTSFALGSPGTNVERVPPPGAKVDRYTVGERLGSGATGSVFTAHDPELDRTIALKLLHSRHAQRERIQREARALARLAHPNVVAVFDAGTFEGELFIAMELVGGTNLRAWMDVPRSIAEILDVFRQIGRGLAAAHASEIVHRDIKPENILVGTDGRVRIADFGLAGGPDGGIDFIGTPAYMAPEQFEHGGSSTASDQFALCIALYEALYGKRPFPVNLAEEVERGLPPEPRRGIPSSVRLVLTRGLACDPAARFAAMDTLVDALRARRRNRVAIGVVGAVVIGGLGFGLARVSGSAAPLCADAGAELDRVWNPSRIAALHAHFTTTKLPYAEDAWTAVEQRVTRFASEWRAMRTEACSATRIRGVQSDQILALRMQCLDRALVELDAVATLLAGVTATELATAPSTVDALPSLAVCANTTALMAPVQPPNAAEATVVAAISHEIARGSALVDAARWTEAVEFATRVVASANRTTHAPTRAAASFLLGRAQSGAGDATAAEASLRKAYADAELGHDDLLAARSAVELVWVVGQDQARFDDGREWAFHAETKLQRAGGDLDVAARLAGGQGNLSFNTSDYTAAQAHYQRALELRERLYGPDSRAAANALGNLGRAIDASGDNPRALEILTRVVAKLERALGPAHPELAMAFNALSGAQFNHGDFSAALASVDRALAIAEPAFGANHPKVGQYLIHRSYALHILAREPEALAAAERAIAVFDREGGNRVMLVAALAGKGDVQRAIGQHAAALATYERASAIALEIDPGNDFAAGSLENVAGALVDLRRAPEALETYRRALAIRERVAGKDYFENAYAHAGIADAEMLLGHAASAVTSYRTAVRLLEAYDGDPGTLATMRFQLAQALHANRADVREVMSLVETAERVLADAGRPAAKSLEELRAWKRQLAR